MVRLETRPPNIEGSGSVTATDLVKNALRMRPERIIIGECRGGETLDMLQAMNTGHDGSMTTIHANSPRDAIARLETLVMMAGFELPVKAIRQQISGAVDVLIQANRLQGGPRRVTAITEIVGMEQDTIVMQDIYKYSQQGVDEQGKAYGHFACTGVRPSFMDRLESAGVRLPPSGFQRASHVGSLMNPNQRNIFSTHWILSFPFRERVNHERHHPCRRSRSLRSFVRRFCSSCNRTKQQYELHRRSTEPARVAPTPP